MLQSWTLETIVGDQMKVSDDRVTHHSHQKGAFGLNGEMSFTPTWHEEAPPMCPIGVRSVRLVSEVSDRVCLCPI